MARASVYETEGWRFDPSRAGQLDIVFNGSTRRLGRFSRGSNPRIQTMKPTLMRVKKTIGECNKLADELDQALDDALKVVSTKEVKETAERIAAAVAKRS